MQRCKVLSIITFVILLVIVSAPVESKVTPGILTSHDATANIVYHWFSYVPSNMSKTKLNYILITGQNAIMRSDNYDQLINETRNEADRKQFWAGTHGFIILTPVIPRTSSGQTYTVSLDRESLINPADFNQRPDLKVNLMIDELVTLLRADGYNVSDKVFIEGFSAAAMFAQRYCLLHPERVQAIAAGSPGGSLTLPRQKYDSSVINWPVGISDFEFLVKYDFDFDAYKKIPQFIYIGDKDTTSGTVAVGNDDLFTDAQKTFLKQEFGNTDPVRLENQAKYMIEIGCNVKFKLYPGVGHRDTEESINDSFQFLAQFRFTEGEGESADDGLVLNYGVTHGLWHYGQDRLPRWTHLNTVEPALMTAVDIDNDGQDELATTFSGYGLYIYDSGNAPGNMWTQINAVIPENMVRFRNGIACDFGATHGLWYWTRDGGWEQWNTADPDKLLVVDIDDDGTDDLVASFGGYGLYWRNGSGGWPQLNTVIPENMVYFRNGIACDFGASHGLWYWTRDGAWEQWNTADPGQMVAVDIDNDRIKELVVSFSGYGLYYLDATNGWQLLNSVVPSDMKSINLRFFSIVPEAGLSATPLNGPAPLRVQFTDLSTNHNISGNTWDFGDETSSIGTANPAHVYTNPGSYLATLVVSGDGVNDSSSSVEITVREPDIEIPFRTITVDGLPSDWAGINPILNDSEDDSICETGTDIRGYYLAKDNNYLYWRVDTWSGTFSFGSLGNERILVLNFGEMGTPTQGPYPNGISVNLTSGNNAYVLARYDNKEMTGLYGGSTYGRANKVAEGKIRLSDFATLDIHHLNVYYWRGPDVVPQCDEANLLFSGEFP